MYIVFNCAEETVEDGVQSHAHMWKTSTTSNTMKSVMIKLYKNIILIVPVYFIPEINGFSLSKYQSWVYRCSLHLSLSSLALYSISEIDVCSSSPCKNSGMCEYTADGYNCDCQDGYTGEHCETGIYCNVDFV